MHAASGEACAVCMNEVGQADAAGPLAPKVQRCAQFLHACNIPQLRSIDDYLFWCITVNSPSSGFMVLKIHDTSHSVSRISTFCNTLVHTCDSMGHNGSGGSVRAEGRRGRAEGEPSEAWGVRGVGDGPGLKISRVGSGGWIMYLREWSHGGRVFCITCLRLSGLPCCRSKKKSLIVVTIPPAAGA